MTNADSTQMLDLYLDNQLADNERRGFERRLELDAALRAQVDLQRLVDDSLARLFVGPDADRLVPRTPPARSFMAGWSARSRAWAATAAVILIGFAGWRLWSAFGPGAPDPYAPQPYRSLETVYRDTVEGGFEPQWICKDDREFMTWFRRRLGQPVLLAQSDLVEAAGLGICNTITPQTMYLLARVAPHPGAPPAEVLVFADRLKSDPGQALDPESEFRLFRRELGKLVLYELTPLERPFVLELFFDPEDRPAEP